jgi:thioredoxin-related protein
MKKPLALLSAAVMALSALAASSTPAGFTDDLDAALDAAKKSGKTVYAVFSGSDWCYWCKVLEEGYLSKKEFVKEASKKLELVFIDSPRDKTVLSGNAREKNPGLVKKYGIRVFPTAMFISQDGNGVKASRPDKGMSPKEYAKKLAKEAKKIPQAAKGK